MVLISVKLQLSGKMFRLCLLFCLQAYQNIPAKMNNNEIILDDLALGICDHATTLTTHMNLQEGMFTE